MSAAAARDVYVTSWGRCLPGEPIPSEQIEEYIGSVGSRASGLRDRVIANSGIRTRHYAIDRSQRTLMSSSAMAAAAVREALERSSLAVDDVELLAAATSVVELIVPGFASMVHGELGIAPPCEIASFHGVCCCGVAAMKAAYHQVALGDKDVAVTCACEFTSRILKSSRFASVESVDADGNVAMEMAFLRYILSDGAGAAVLQPRPADEGISMRIEWITLNSYASTSDACMYMGAASNDCAKSYLDYPTVEEAVASGALALRQNLGLLPQLVRSGIDEYERLLELGMFDPERVRYVAAHYSTEIMRGAVLREIERRGCPAPDPDAWYTNLHSVGNVGCAAIYVILEQLAREGGLEPGDQVLAFIPESGRMSIAFMLLTAVDAASAGAAA